MVRVDVFDHFGGDANGFYRGDIIGNLHASGEDEVVGAGEHFHAEDLWCFHDPEVLPGNGAAGEPVVTDLLEGFGGLSGEGSSTGVAGLSDALFDLFGSDERTCAVVDGGVGAFRRGGFEAFDDGEVALGAAVDAEDGFVV